MWIGDTGELKVIVSLFWLNRLDVCVYESITNFNNLLCWLAGHPMEELPDEKVRE